MRVLQIGLLWGAQAGSGGGDRVFSDVVRHLPALGIQVEALVASGTSVSPPVRSFAEHDASFLKRAWNARKAVIKTLMNNRISLVATHFPPYNVLTLRTIKHTPLVVHFHGPWFRESAEDGQSVLSSAAKRQVEGLVHRRADRIIVLSRAFAEVAARDFRIPEEKIRVVPGHADINRFTHTTSQPRARLDLKLPPNRPIIVTVRRLVRRMGLPNLLDAMTIVSQAVPDVLLCIVGTGPLLETLKRRVAETGLTRHVMFMGFVPDDVLPLLYRSAQFSVTPSTSLEGFGLVVAESLSAGIPSLVTPIGGLPEVVAPLSNSLLMASCHPQDMAAKMIDVLLGRDILPDEQSCRNYAVKNFSVQTAMERTAKVYRELV